MSADRAPPVCVGADVCGKGWVAIATGRETVGVFGRTIAELAAKLPQVDAIGIDIPIGWPLRRSRVADELARTALGARGSTVFVTPPREALLAPTYADALELAREATGKGISSQAYALRRRILEVEAWLPDAPAPVWEVHPELSFTHLIGHPARHPKKTWAGLWERLVALRGAGVDVPASLGEAGAAASADDVLDAAAAAWSARRCLEGVAASYPDPPETDPSTGRAVAIWA